MNRRIPSVNPVWEEYICDCSCKSTYHLQETFNAVYKDKLIHWKGIPQEKSDNVVKLQPLPFEADSPNICIYLICQNFSYQVKLGEPLDFFGYIRSYSLFRFSSSLTLVYAYLKEMTVL